MIPIFVPRYNSLYAEVADLYNSAKVLQIDDPSNLLNLDPDINGIFGTSQNLTELEYYWIQWREVSGAKMRTQFLEILSLSKTVAR